MLSPARVRFLKVIRLLCTCLVAALWIAPPAVSLPGTRTGQSQAAEPATADAATLVAPKWLATPTLDGQCNDAAYAQAGVATLLATTSPLSATVSLLHSGLDLYLCFANLPIATAAQVVVRVDSNHSRASSVKPGDIQFTVSSSGMLSTAQGTASGAFAPLAVPASDFAARVATTPQRRWNAELRVSLEWLGGYARTDGLSLALEQANGTPMLQWPQNASARAPATWGDLTLNPVYAQNLSAGSVFLDGRESYLVVPYAPELNPRAITLEAWVKVVGGSCGTLVGNGRAQSYWLALCNALQFSYNGVASASTGVHTLDGGWHHVAVMQDVDGIRTFYVDGVLDAHPGWQRYPEVGAQTPQYLGVSDRMLRIGSDRDVPANTNHLHAYLRELRIWNGVRSAQQIHDTAFQNLTQPQPGLLAVWPFTSDLQDVVGGHNAGLVGNAALARESRDVSQFPPPATFHPYPYPGRTPPAAWKALLPARVQSVKLDGVCSPTEYTQAARIALEPDRLLAPHAFLGRDALYLCTGPLFGQATRADGVTLWLDHNTRAGSQPNPADLRLLLKADGRWSANTGDGQGWDGAPPVGISVAVVSGTVFAPQEDFSVIHAPWWSSEVRIPYSALAPFQANQALRLALQYQGSMPAAGAVDLALNTSHRLERPLNQLLSGRWPASFNENQPNTWGWVNAQRLRAFLPVVNHPRTAHAAVTDASVAPLKVADGEEVDHIEGWQSGDDPWPLFAPNPPTDVDYNVWCPSGLESLSYAFDSDNKWPRIDSVNFRTVKTEGKLTSINVSNSDSPFIHSSHDVDMVATVDANRFGWQVVNGGSEMQFESESGGFSDYARPTLDDHITVVGRWDFDCGHDAHSESHPDPIFESDHEAVRPVVPGRDMQPVRVAKVWMNSVPGGAFSYVFDGNFSFDLQLPAQGGWRPFLAVTQGDGSLVAATLNGTKVHVTVTPPQTTGQWYWEMAAGYLIPGQLQYPPYTRYESGYHAYTVVLDSVGIVDASSGAGYSNAFWNLDVNVNGTWRTLWNDMPVFSGQTFALNTPPFVTTGGDLVLHASGYSDWGYINFGDAVIGHLKDLADNQPHVWSVGNWILNYHVLTGGHVPALLGDASNWGVRVQDEPNDDIYHPTDLGTLSVPGPGQPVAFHPRGGYITEAPLKLTEGGSTVIVLGGGPDVDAYQFALDEMAYVTPTVTAGLNLQVTEWSPWYWNLPPDLALLVGYSGATFKVSSVSGQAGDRIYTLGVQTSWRDLPPDWGEAADLTPGGRLVDLVTPAPNAVVSDDPNSLSPARRSLDMPLAWQHLPNDVDYYDVYIPKPSQPISYSCEFDTPAMLNIYAPDEHLFISSGFVSMAGDHALHLEPLQNTAPFHYRTEVTSVSGKRSFYWFSALWTDAKYYTESQCALLRFLAQTRQRLSGYAPAGGRTSLWSGGRGPNLPDPGPELAQATLYALGAMQTVQVGAARSLDVFALSGRNQPVIARLYDTNGVLLGESVPPDEAVARTAKTQASLIPQSQLTVAGLNAGGLYLLQFVPAFDLGANSAVGAPVGIAQH